MKDFPTAIQTTWKNCGPTCVRIIAEYYGVDTEISDIELTEEGVTLLELSDALNKMGFKTTGLRCNFDTLRSAAPLPCIVHWENWHYVVVYRITDTHVYVSDPATGLLKYTLEDFTRMWSNVVLTVELKQN